MIETKNSKEMQTDKKTLTTEVSFPLRREKKKAPVKFWGRVRNGDVT